MTTKTTLAAVALGAAIAATALVADGGVAANSLPHRAYADGPVISNSGNGFGSAVVRETDLPHISRFRSAQLRYVGGVGHASTALPMPLRCPPPPRLPLRCR
jgi:hypothetical protein